MRALLLLTLFLLLQIIGKAQNLTGKWYGKITQGTGGFSELYDLQLDLYQRKTISGQSYAYIPGILSVKIGLKGFVDGDTIRLAESVYAIKEEIMPITWVACVKNINVKYYKAGNIEYLRGNWNGKSEIDSTACIPGEIILSRTMSGLDAFFSSGGFNHSFPDQAKVLPEFTPVFLNTTIKKVSEIEVHSRDIELRINDYENVDNDTVSVFFNRSNILNKARIAKRPIKLTVTLDSQTDINEIILFAENLGNIPPNTSQLLIIDGSKTHRLIIESDKQKTAAVYLRYKPK